MTLIDTFTPNPPYDFARTASLSRFYSLLNVVQDDALWRALRIGEAVALVRLSGHGTVDAPQITAELVASEGEVDATLLHSRVERMLNLHQDMRPFYTLAQSDPVLWRLVEPLRGLHTIQTDSLFEALCFTMIEQQIALSAAQKAEDWLIDHVGERIEHDGEVYRLFPTPVHTAALTVADLTPLKITFQRMERLLMVARQISDGTLDLEALRGESLADAQTSLLALKGVGHWTAAWTLIRGLGQFIYIGSADVALRAAVNQYWFDSPGRAERPVTDATFHHYGIHAGVAAFYTLMQLAIERYG